ncbi:MAG: response regulator transcription factor [Syntrophaceae bacterium]
MNKIKVLITDDQIMVRKGLCQLLEIGDDIEVIGEAGNGMECIKLLETLSPDIIFMDLKMPGISGIEATRLICQKDPNAKVIILTIYEDQQYVTEAIQAGAKGYVLKQVTRDELVRIVHSVMEDKPFLDPNVTTSVFSTIRHSSQANPLAQHKEIFTERELEIILNLTRGLSDKKIGEQLFISKYTVRSHLKNIFRKLKVSSRSEAIIKALDEKIVNMK